MKYKIRLENKENYNKAAKSIKHWGYKYLLNDYAIHAMLNIGNGSAYIWFERIDDRVLLAHVCAAPEHRGRWFTSRVWSGIIWAIELLGAEYICTTENSLNDYLERLGWFKSGGIRCYKV